MSDLLHVNAATIELKTKIEFCKRLLPRFFPSELATANVLSFPLRFASTEVNGSYWRRGINVGQTLERRFVTSVRFGPFRY